MTQTLAFIKTIRPEQWSKNLILLAGLIFSRQFGHFDKTFDAFIALAAFCLLSSAVYVFNDIKDVHRDKAHPVKCKRPLASGILSRNTAWILGAFCLILGMAISFILSVDFMMFSFYYLILQIMYTLWLKNLVIIDVMAISTGFVIRAMAGAVAVDAAISHWLLVCTMLLALFLALAKRRNELVCVGSCGQRETLNDYSISLLDMLMTVATATTLIAYILYTVSPDTADKFQTTDLVYTTPFVMYGLFRYLYLVNHCDMGESPSRILVTDIPLIVNLIMWTASVFIVIY